MIGNVGADERINLRDLSKAFKDRLIFYKIVHNPEHSPEELNKLLGTINGIIQKFILFLIASKTIEAVFGVSKQEQNIKNLFKDFETVKQEINNILIRESKIIESKLNKLGSRATNEQAIANLKKELYYHVKVGLKNIILYFVSVNINKVPVNTNKEQEKLSILKEEVETKIKSIAEKISMKIPLLIEEILKNASRKREKVKTKKGVQEVKIYNPRTVNKKLSEGVGALQAYNLSDFLINQLDTVLEKWEAIKKKKILEKQEIKDENVIELEVLKEIPKIFTDPKNGLYVMIEAMVSGLTKDVFEEFRKGVIREIQEEILTVLSN
ncbi:MAG: hypothetical protein NZM44_02030, partial [Candidatus Calescibacterium sp.]|nr:hypothetical protein [Candidatus Calescibacterium sp.]